MKRKTNLFYTSGNDSKFVTFSNYTEAMTANFVATDYKLFPSAFLCLNIPSLTADTKETFIKDYLTGYYENKLAIARDACEADDTLAENKMLYLGWLYEVIKKFDADAKVTYAGNITEVGADGEYADMICIISKEDKAKSYIEKQNTVIDFVTFTSKDKDYLYGWTRNNTATGNVDWLGPDTYKTVKPIFDEDAHYNWGAKYLSLEQTDEPISSIKFNVIIPLFSLTNINVNNEQTSFDTSIDLSTNLVDTENQLQNAYTRIPIGVWFADELIELKRDEATNYTPSWSLVLSAQFKAFPYSNKYNVADEGTVAYKQAYGTFANALTQQNELSAQFVTLANRLSDISAKLEKLETKINNLGTQKNIDNLELEFLTFKKEVQSALNAAQITGSNSSLTWDTSFTNQ